MRPCGWSLSLALYRGSLPAPIPARACCPSPFRVVAYARFVAEPKSTHEEWRRRVPELVRRCVELWKLRLGEPYEAGAAGYAVRAERPDGSPAVLKLVFPHRESEHEADALELWRGNGAVELLARTEEGGAMLIERCEPGTRLAEAGPEVALDVLTGLLPRLWVPAGAPFHTLADEAAWWVSYLPKRWKQGGRPF
jgi:streptomycin 6-kinase